MRTLRASLALLLAAGAAGAQPTSPGEAGRVLEALTPLHVLLHDDQPTPRALLGRLSLLVPGLRVQRLAPGAAPEVASRLREAEKEGRGALLAFGSELGGLCLRARGRLPLVVVTTGLTRPAMQAPPARPFRHVHVRPPPGALRSTLAALLPALRTVGVVGARVAGGTTVAEGPELPGLELRPDMSPEALLKLWAPQIDALVLPDLEDLTPLAETLLEEARARRLPVITTAPWLLRSGTAVGVLPDLDLWALRLLMALRGVVSGAPAREAPGPPARVVADLAADVFRRHPPGVRALAGVDVLRNWRKGEARASAGH